MTFSAGVGIVIMLLVIAIAIKAMRPRHANSRSRRGGAIGPGAAGAFYEFLSEDRRKAIEIVLEDKAAYSDPEVAEGDLPQLEKR